MILIELNVLTVVSHYSLWEHGHVPVCAHGYKSYMRDKRRGCVRVEISCYKPGICTALK